MGARINNVGIWLLTLLLSLLLACSIVEKEQSTDWTEYYQNRTINFDISRNFIPQRAKLKIINQIEGIWKVILPIKRVYILV